MRQSPWSRHYPDRWVPDQDPRWREHDGSDALPCWPGLLVHVLFESERGEKAFGPDPYQAVDCAWHKVVAWRLAKPDVWYVERGNVGEVDVDRLKAGDLFDLFALPWNKTPHGHRYWENRYLGESLMTDCDRAFIDAVIKAYDEPCVSAEPSANIKGLIAKIRHDLDRIQSLIEGAYQ